MRKIGLVEIIVFSTLLLITLISAIVSTEILLGTLSLGDFRGVALVAATVLLSYLYAFVIYRLFLRVMPLSEGEIEEGSRAEFGYHVYLLFYLILFYPLMRSGAVPVPLMRLIYVALGARLGQNSYSAGLILDPPLVEVGADTIIGQNALLVPHIIEGRRLAHYKIHIGNNVTIGAHAILHSGVSVGDDAIVASGAVVTKDSKIGANEVWGGIPARFLHSRRSNTPAGYYLQAPPQKKSRGHGPRL